MASNTPGADLNEIHLGLILNNGQWTGGMAAAKETYDLRKERVKQDEQAWRIGQTYSMKDAFLQKASELGYSGGVKNVYWTARADFSFTDLDPRFEPISTNNPSDLLVEFNRSTNVDKYLGLSAKSIKSPTGRAPFKNKGMNEIQKELLGGTQLTSFITEQTTEFLNMYPRYSTTASARKSQIAAESKTIKDAIAKYANDYMYAGLQEVLIKGLKSAGDIDVKYYCLNNLYDVIRLPRFIKVTGRGTTQAQYNASVTDPLNSSAFKALVSNGRVSYEKIGQTSVGIKVGGRKILKMRFKFESTPMATTMKFSVEYWD